MQDRAVLEYTISPVGQNGEPSLKIELRFRGNQSGQTYLYLPSSWADQDELYLEFQGLSCASSGVAIVDTGQPELKKICHRPNEEFKL